ncbi:hypothetical protein DSM07_10380 [Oenococcus sp. UCMA 16435]|mgnify:CR=1 FL=1|nr:hypothetical protein [Oenococcus sp. UCMA 14587]QHW12473.1 hypothetical protein DSM07_10380 [Oenococcus sp. UCMA 16435]
MPLTDDYESKVEDKMIKDQDRLINDLIPTKIKAEINRILAKDEKGKGKGKT